MTGFSIAFLLGIVILTMFEALPNWQWVFGLLPVILIAIKWSRSIFVMGLVIGVLWALFHAYIKLYPSLDRNLEGIDLDIIGMVYSIPSQNGCSVWFDLSVIEAKLTKNHSNTESPKCIFLSWYGVSPKIRLGENWQLQVRLKRP